MITELGFKGRGGDRYGRGNSWARCNGPGRGWPAVAEGHRRDAAQRRPCNGAAVPLVDLSTAEVIPPAQESTTSVFEDDGWQDDDGCPDPDNDLDGVMDIFDGAPSQPEDHDGWQDMDGTG